MKAHVYLFSFTLLVWSAAAPAQSDIHSGSSNSNHRSVSTLSGGINLRSVEGAPFSADVVNETVEAMPDGTSSRHATHGKMFRDSAGRTRSETELQSPVGAAPRRFVTIFDPVQELSIVLDVAAQTARISHLPAAPAVSTRDLKLVARAQAAHQSGHAATPDAEELGAMMMEGFSVTGVRRSQPVEAGAAKDRAVTESWFSPELKVELLATTRVSPSTTRTTRLTNIVPGEPDPALFEAPAGYTIQESSLPKRVVQ